MQVVQTFQYLDSPFLDSVNRNVFIPYISNLETNSEHYFKIVPEGMY